MPSKKSLSDEDIHSLLCGTDGEESVPSGALSDHEYEIISEGLDRQTDARHRRAAGADRRVEAPGCGVFTGTLNSQRSTLKLGTRSASRCHDERSVPVCRASVRAFPFH